MALSIKHEEADRLARELSELTGETLTEAVLRALEERLQRQRASQDKTPLHTRIMAIGATCAARPVLDDRDDDAIVGYDDRGLPT